MVMVALLKSGVEERSGVDSMRNVSLLLGISQECSTDSARDGNDRGVDLEHHGLELRIWPHD